MNVEHAARRVINRLGRLNRVEQGCGLRSLEHADMTWPFRVREIQLRLATLGAARHDMRPSMTELECLGAWVLATIVAVDEAEQADPTTGEAAA